MAEHFYYSIASGSSGNCGLYVSDGTAVLIDVGVSLRKLTAALAAFDMKPGELDALNARMREAGRGYILVGPGRWGSSDPFLGIPVKWQQITEARVIVECGLERFRVEPSQGTHFFQNVTSLGVGYLTINPFMGDGRFDAERLGAMPAAEEGEYLRRVSFPAPLWVYIDGRSNKGIVRTEPPAGEE